MLMGLYLRFLRPGKVLEASFIGFLLVLASIYGGQLVSESSYAGMFTLAPLTLAIAIIIYGYAASALPVWLLLAPRDYLATFIKLGVIGMLAVGIVFVQPTLQMPAFSRFVDGTGPVLAGKIFPFCFITIACGAISGFHSLISSGTTPKMIARETDALHIGYGAMLLESFVAVMAMIAACALDPGVYFAVNAPAGIVGKTAEAAAATISGWGFPVSADNMMRMAKQVGEVTLFNRTGGAPSLALGMAHIFSRWGGDAFLGFWYHFAIMFEALFIQTIIDSGTRVGRFTLQFLGGAIWKPAGNTASVPGALIASAIIVLGWGYFLIQGVLDPLGGINSLWPLFGIANQLLATLALCIATTIILKLHGPKFLWVTIVPLIWLGSVTFTAAYQKIWSPQPRIGFLAAAEALLAAPHNAQTDQLVFNNRLDAVVCFAFMALVAFVIIDSVRIWAGIIGGSRATDAKEAPFIPSRLLPEEA
jgi:carbon starvation protein